WVDSVGYSQIGEIAAIDLAIANIDVREKAIIYTDTDFKGLSNAKRDIISAAAIEMIRKISHLGKRGKCVFLDNEMQKNSYYSLAHTMSNKAAREIKEHASKKQKTI